MGISSQPGHPYPGQSFLSVLCTCLYSGTLMSFLEETGVEIQPTLGGQEQQMWLGL